MSGRISTWARGLEQRHGRATLILLALILALGFGLRAYRVVEPLATPGDDSAAYFALSKGLYEEGDYDAYLRDASDWSPGAPLIYAAAYALTGGAREGTARIVELLFGLAAILVVYLLGRRLGGRNAGLIAALGVAVYPPFIHSTGALFSEPAAIFTLPAAILAFLWASGPAATTRTQGEDADSLSGMSRSGDMQSVSGAAQPRSSSGAKREARAPKFRERESVSSPPARWLVPGILFGLTALIRPEYLLVGLAFVVLAFLRVVKPAGWKPALAAAALTALGLLAPIVPWTIHNAIALDRFVPLSTGGGKALYVGTNLPADGEYQRVKAMLLERQRGIELEPGSEALDRISPTPLFDRVAERYPQSPRDEALGRIGKENLYDYVEEDPLGYAAMTARKVWRMWSAGIGEAMSSAPGRAIQVALVLLGLAGLVLLAGRRRWWEAVATATPLVLVTAVGAASLAAPRRNEILMALIFPLAAVALVRTGAALSSRRSWSDSRQASSPPS